MKEKIKNDILLIIAIIILGCITISTVYLEKERARDDFDDIFLAGRELGYLSGQRTVSEFMDYQFYEFDGQVFSIDFYDTVNISDMGSNLVTDNGTLFVPDQFVIYKMNLDLCGFPWCDPSQYITYTSGTRHVSFRYCRDGPITEPGYYRFYYLDVDIMEITHWE